VLLRVRVCGGFERAGVSRRELGRGRRRERGQGKATTRPNQSVPLTRRGQGQVNVVYGVQADGRHGALCVSVGGGKGVVGGLSVMGVWVVGRPQPSQTCGGWFVWLGK